MAIEYLTMQEAAKYLGISRVALWKFIKNKNRSITVFSCSYDKRKRYIRKDDIERLRVPQPV